MSYIGWGRIFFFFFVTKCALRGESLYQQLWIQIFYASQGHIFSTCDGLCHRIEDLPAVAERYWSLKHSILVRRDVMVSSILGCHRGRMTVSINRSFGQKVQCFTSCSKAERRGAATPATLDPRAPINLCAPFTSTNLGTEWRWWTRENWVTSVVKLRMLQWVWNRTCGSTLVSRLWEMRKKKTLPDYCIAENIWYCSFIIG